MATPILMPRQGQSVESCILVKWLVQPGAAVTKGAPIASIETDKAVFEVESPEDGTLLAVFFKEGDDVPVLTTIAAVGKPGENADTLRPGAPTGQTEDGIRNTEPAPANREPPTRNPEPGTPSTSASASPRARNHAARIGVDATALAGTGPGGRVIERDVIAAAAQGRLSPVVVAATAAGTAVPATGTGPGGMIVSADLSRVVPASPVAAPVAAAAGDQTVTVAGVRKIIAERMRQSLAATAQLTLHRGFDATSALAYRAQVKAHGEALGLPNITLNDMIVFAVSRALKAYPDLNAHFLGDRIVKFAAVNVGIAMDTPRGLMVPVFRGVDALSLAQISLAIKPVAKSAQAGAVNPDLLRGGTFTITNLGALGIETFTPVLNAPEVAILGVGAPVLRPVEKDGKIGFASYIDLSLTIDHQAVDGAPAARFLGDLARMLENFELALGR